MWKKLSVLLVMVVAFGLCNIVSVFAAEDSKTSVSSQSATANSVNQKPNIVSTKYYNATPDSPPTIIVTFDREFYPAGFYDDQRISVKDENKNEAPIADTKVVGKTFVITLSTELDCNKSYTVQMEEAIFDQDGICWGPYYNKFVTGENPFGPVPVGVFTALGNNQIVPHGDISIPYYGSFEYDDSIAPEITDLTSGNQIWCGYSIDVKNRLVTIQPTAEMIKINDTLDVVIPEGMLKNGKKSPRYEFKVQVKEETEEPWANYYVSGANDSISVRAGAASEIKQIVITVNGEIKTTSDSSDAYTLLENNNGKKNHIVISITSLNDKTKTIEIITDAPAK